MPPRLCTTWARLAFPIPFCSSQAQERVILQHHSAIGGKILSNSSSGIIQMAERVALFHHENWDGNGYPHRLRGENIPLEARIVAVADVYDALRSDRVYRRGLEEAKVLEILRRDRGRKFEPELLDLFFEHLTGLRELLSHHMGEEETDITPLLEGIH